MLEVIKNHDELTTFYFMYEFEIEINWIEVNNPVYSVCEKENGNIISAATVSFRMGHYILDYIAVKVCQFNKGHGRKLINNILEWAKNEGIDEIYLVAKQPKFFEKTGAKYVDDNIGYLDECNNCDYFKSCNPKMMKYEV